MKNIMLIFLAVIALLLCGCGQNTNDDVKSSGSVVAKKVGGTANIVLPPKQKLVSVTWKLNDMWILYRPFREGEFAEEYTYKEDSTFGMMEATLRIKEQE